MKSFRELIFYISVCFNILFMISAVLFAGFGWDMEKSADIGTAVGGVCGALIGAVTIIYVFKTYREQRSSVMYSDLVKQLDRLEIHLQNINNKDSNCWPYNLRNTPSETKLLVEGVYGPGMEFVNEYINKYEELGSVSTLIRHYSSKMTDYHVVDLKTKLRKILDLYFSSLEVFFKYWINRFYLMEPKNFDEKNNFMNYEAVYVHLLGLVIRYQQISESLHDIGILNESSLSFKDSEVEDNPEYWTYKKRYKHFYPQLRMMEYEVNRSEFS